MWLPREDILTFEEIVRLVGVFGTVGVDRVRVTGGEPLLRKDLHVLIAQLAARPHVQDLALTTNGLLLASQALALKAAGLHRLTVSLDTPSRSLRGADPLRRTRGGARRHRCRARGGFHAPQDRHRRHPRHE